MIFMMTDLNPLSSQINHSYAFYFPNGKPYSIQIVLNIEQM